MAATACSSMNSQMLPPCPVESTQLGAGPGTRPARPGERAGERHEPVDLGPAIPASARARFVPWKLSSNAVLSSTRPQSEVDAPTMATRRPGILRLARSSRAPCPASVLVLVSGFSMKCAQGVGPDAPSANRNGGLEVPQWWSLGTMERRRRIDTGQGAGYGECPSGPASGLAHRRATSAVTGRPGGGGAPTVTHHARRRMSETTENPVGDDVTRRIEDGICWITLNRPDAGNAMTQFMRDQIAGVGPRRLERSVRPRRRHHCGGRQGLLQRRRPARRPAPTVAQARRRPATSWACRPHDSRRLAGTRGIHHRL